MEPRFTLSCKGCEAVLVEIRGEEAYVVGSMRKHLARDEKTELWAFRCSSCGTQATFDGNVSWGGVRVVMQGGSVEVVPYGQAPRLPWG